VPEFGPTIDAHLEDYDEVLQHPIFGDFARFVSDAHDRGADELVARCLEFADRALRTGDPMVRNLVQVSFVENFGPFRGRELPFVESWPDALRAEAHRQRDWQPGDPGGVSMG
jgi:hypothetical protein